MAFTAGQFARVDASGQGGELAGYLEDLSHDPFVVEWRGRGFDALRLGPCQTVLDAGCGTGDHTQRLAAHVGSDGMVVGVDLSHEMVNLGRQAMASDLPLYFVIGDAASLPFGDAVFDAARCERLLLHTAEPAATVREFTRVTRPGGRIVLLEPDWGSLVTAIDDQALAARILAHHLAGMAHPRVGRDLERLMCQAGLIDIQLQPLALTTTDRKRARRLMPFLIDDGAPNDGIPEADRAAWFAALDRLERSGRWWTSMQVFVACGTTART